MNINEILKTTKEMGVEIVNNKSGKHFILDKNNQKVEFKVDMLTKAEQSREKKKIKENKRISLLEGKI